MQPHDLSSWQHMHEYAHGHEHENERRTRFALILAAGMMLIEIIGGWWFNSMALVADGWHMSTHAVALGVGAFSYAYARLSAGNPAYSFGPGKVYALGSFTSAVILMLVAVMVLGESLWRLVSPERVSYQEAVPIAVIGLAVNLASAWLLRDDHDGHAHAHDHNIRAAYAHVAADALVSVLTIIALLLGQYAGWWFMDAFAGIVGAVIIGQWSVSLLRATAPVLLDRQDSGITERIRAAVEADGDSQVADLHVWSVAPNRLSAIVAIVTHGNRDASFYKTQLAPLGLSHVTVEVNRCAEHG